MVEPHVDPEPYRPLKKKKEWKGEKARGPQPARHIPWPEIFRHHISVIEGHVRMLEMVQKHTVPNSGNWATISPMVDLSHEMLRHSKIVARDFVPAKDTFADVPLGSSSQSMYPGYSPADHQYGTASKEFGKTVAEARKRGIDTIGSKDGPEYQIGQQHGAKRMYLFQKSSGQQGDTDAANGVQSNGNDTQRPTNGDSSKATPATTKTDADAADEAKREEEASGDIGGENPFFVVDTNPTPVNLGDKASKEQDHSAEDGERKPKKKKSKSTSKNTQDPKAESETKPSKKRSAEGQPSDSAKEETAKKAMKEKPSDITVPVVEFEDISDEVQARLKAKELRRREKEAKKKEKKRKRESDGSVIVPSTPVETPADKPKKKKTRKDSGQNTDESGEKLANGHEVDSQGDVIMADGEGKKKHKKKKSRS